MYCISLESNDPYLNLAIEELLLKSYKDEYLLLYVNSPSVIIGKHQSGHREVNTKFVYENQIPVIRRISGGGTVFHDRGNLNFSFIIQSEHGKQVDFRKYTQPVIDFLTSMGIKASFEGKNDLKVDGFKISGNAEHIHGDRVLHHGTLLFSTSLEMLRNSIRRDPSHYISRAVVSNPSSVANLIEKLDCLRDINELRSEMMNYFIRNFPGNVPYDLTHAEIAGAKTIGDSKYKTWEWNWGYGPDYTFNNSFDLNKVHHTCSMFVKGGIIRECTIEGSDQLKDASEKIIGCRHMVEDLSKLFTEKNIFLTGEEIFGFF
jgi:lipoate-protein ligase A